MDSVTIADIYAAAAHAAVGQRRKYTDEPYIVHPREVAEIIRVNIPNHTPEMLAACKGHDLLEDTDCTEEDLLPFFGPVATSYIVWMTDIHAKTKRKINKILFILATGEISTKDRRVFETQLEILKAAYPKRSVRKNDDLEHMARAPAEVQHCKVADFISNTRTIVKYDLDFAETYLEEKTRALDVLTKADPMLVMRARELISDGETQIVCAHLAEQEALRGGKS